LIDHIVLWSLDAIEVTVCCRICELNVADHW